MDRSIAQILCITINGLSLFGAYLLCKQLNNAMQSQSCVVLLDTTTDVILREDYYLSLKASNRST